MNKIHDIDLYQIEAHLTGVTYRNSNSPMYFIYPLLGLAGEVGELVDKVKKILRNAGDPETREAAMEALRLHLPALQKEFGDVAWYWSESQKRMGMLASETLGGNIEKIRDRANRNVIRSEGDNR